MSTETSDPPAPDARRTALAFARAYPAIAAHLAAPSDDPDVERLAEGFIHLGARVGRVLEATASAAAARFASLLFPELHRPLPSTTILELSSTDARRIQLPAGAEFGSVAVDGTRCRFTASAATPIVPWRVDDARLTWSSTRGQLLEVTLAGTAAETAGSAVDPLFPLRLHVAGDARTALTLMLWLHQHLEGVDVVSGAKSLSLPKSAVRPVGLTADEALLPPEPFEHPGYRLLREYIALPARFAFIAIDSRDVATIGPDRRVTLAFRFDAPLPAGVAVTRERLRVNCAPVANVFATTADPVRPSLERPTHVLRPAGLAPAHGEILSVRRVTARRPGRATPIEVAPMTDFGAAAPDALADVFYTLRTLRSVNGGSEVELALGTPTDAGIMPPIDVLSLDVWATNRALPSALGVGDVCVHTALLPARVRFRNITAVTPYRSAPHGDELHWRTLAAVSLAALPLASRDAVRGLFHLLNLHPLADAQAARSHAQRLEAIVDVTSAPATERFDDVVVRGHEVSVRLDERGFDGDGDAFLFGAVLARVFGYEAPLNTFVRTTVHLAATGRTIRFAALNGERILGE